MIGGVIIVGAREWLLPAAVLGGVALLTVAYTYWRTPARPWLCWLAAALKVAGIAALIGCLVEPLLSEKRPRAGANLFLTLTDNSQSLRMRNQDAAVSRGQQMIAWLDADSNWRKRLGQDFDVRHYAFDHRVHAVSDPGELTFDGSGSALAGSLSTIGQRYQGRSVAGILLFTDGIATDRLSELLDRPSLPPVFPVLAADGQSVRDVRIDRVSVSQTDFEDAPVTIVSDVIGQGFDGRQLVAELRSEQGELVESQEAVCLGSEQPTTFRFQFRPEEPGVSFYEVRICEQGQQAAFEDPDSSGEATIVNNRRWVMVRRSRGEFRVLYVAGRPNWEFKFLRRALQEDPEVDLVGLLRIAKREAKFDFRGHDNETTNPLYRGFGNREDEQAEQYDEPVLLRVGTRDDVELRGGFPRAAEELFAYDAILVDDVEAGFFTRDQLSLIQQFVSQRGGGFMMFGGQETFQGGAYRHTPIDEILPVYVDRISGTAADDQYRQILTREGLLQPWMRLRSTEAAEQQRLDAMPSFRTLNRLESIKPGASVLSYVRASSGAEFPAVVTQRFGNGRTVALTVGDLWRWGLRRGQDEPEDLGKAWRQMIRWLVADVPKRLDVSVVPSDSDPDRAVRIRVAVRDAVYEPLDNATISVHVTGPDERLTLLTAEADDKQPGVYFAQYAAAEPGCYRAEVHAQAADGSPVAEVVTGWTAEPGYSEFERFVPQRDQLQRLAEQTGGEMVEPDHLTQFVAGLPQREHVVTEPWIHPFWHQWWVFTLAVCCFVGEWGLRRWKGLP